MLILFTVELCAMIRLVSRQALSQQKKQTLYFFAANVRHVVNSKWENWLQCLQLHSLYQYLKLEEKGGIFCFVIQKTSGFPTNIAYDPETRSSVAPNERRTGLARRTPVNDRAPRHDAAGPRSHLYT